MPAPHMNFQTARSSLDNVTMHAGLSRNFRFKLPKELKVGTIDRLFAATDELAKLDLMLTNLMKKIQKTFYDNIKGDANNKSESKSEDHKEPVSAAPLPKELLIQVRESLDRNVPAVAKRPQEVFLNFRWDESLYSVKEPIDRLAARINDEFAKKEEELRRYTAELADIKSVLTAHERRDKGSLLVRPISKFISPEDIIETDHFTTLLICVPRQKEQEFKDTYMQLEENYYKRHEEEKKRQREQEERERKRQQELEAKERSRLNIVDVKPTEEASAEQAVAEESESSTEAKEEPAKPAKKGSSTVVTPTVVPGSAKKLIGEEQVKDEFVLYRVVLLCRNDGVSIANPDGVPASASSQAPTATGSERIYPNVERYKMLCRDQRWSIRPNFVYDPMEEERSKKAYADLLDKRQKKWEHLILWCETQYEEVFFAWMHVKAMRTFVEACLRYGISREWLAQILVPNKGCERKLRAALAKLYGGDNPEDSGVSGLSEAELSASGASGEYYPYVYIPVDLDPLDSQ